MVYRYRRYCGSSVSGSGQVWNFFGLSEPQESRKALPQLSYFPFFVRPNFRVIRESDPDPEWYENANPDRNIFFLTLTLCVLYLAYRIILSDHATTF